MKTDGDLSHKVNAYKQKKEAFPENLIWKYAA